MKIPIYVYSTVENSLKNLGIQEDDEEQIALLSVLDRTLLGYWQTNENRVVIHLTFSTFESPYSEKLINKLDEVLNDNAVR